MCRPWKFAETSSWSKTSSKSEAGAVALLCVRLKVGPRRCIAAAMKGRREVYKGRKNVSGGGRGGGGGGGGVFERLSWRHPAPHRLCMQMLH
mmetsp:Transcript_33585/g.72828  ORF Transcript_33585/g.72828 Transcript_33585/m.72828 type:complete len:92 (-) Transcript_33585:601-876(-)